MPHRVVPVQARRATTAMIEPLEERRLLSATISLINEDGLPGNDRMVFNRIQIPNTSIGGGIAADIVHDTQTLEIENTGDQPLVIKSLSLSNTNDWELVNPPAAGTSVAAGKSVDVTVQFIAQKAPANQPTDETNDVVSTDGLAPSQTGGVYDATLTINSNDPNTPTSAVQLAGYWQYESEHEEEPNLQTIVNDLFGYDTVISNTLEPQYPNNGSTPVYYGDEVASGLWDAADPSQPVTVREIASFHTQENETDTGPQGQLFDWYSEASPNNDVQLFAQQLGSGQTLLPENLADSGPAQGSFSPGNGVFGFDVDGEKSQDSLNTVDIDTYGRSGHAVRFYPLINSNGDLVPNTWIIGMDYQNSSYDNSDFQDGVYLVTNVRPTTQAPAVTNLQAAAAGSGQVSLSWSAVIDGTLEGYNVYRSTSASGPFTLLNSSPIKTTSYTDTSASGTEYYEVSAVDSAGQSEKADVSLASASSSGNGSSSDPSNGPDLTLSAVTGKFKTSVVGNTMSGPSKVTLTNSGNETAKGTVQINLYVSPSSTSVTGATEVTHVSRSVNLKSGKSVAYALPGFKYSTSLNGQYFLVAQVAATKGITETNTGNNLGASSAITVTPPFVDLVNEFAGPLPDTLIAGKRTALVVPLLNQGNVAAHGVAVATITASTSSSGSGGTTLATLKLPVVLGVGKTAKYNLRFLVPTLTPGTYHLVINVALPGDVDSANNTVVSTSTFTA